MYFAIEPAGTPPNELAKVLDEVKKIAFVVLKFPLNNLIDFSKINELVITIKKDISVDAKIACVVNLWKMLPLK
jgi:hypothetical protein